MRVKPLAALTTTVLALGALALLIFRHALKNTHVVSAYSWHLAGQVVDAATNPVAGVSISVQAKPRITGLDRLRERAPNTIWLAGTSDASGKFALDFTASAFAVTFVKSGFTNRDFVFGPYVNRAPDTNQVLQVRLDPMPR